MTYEDLVRIIESAVDQYGADYAYLEEAIAHSVMEAINREDANKAATND